MTHSTSIREPWVDALRALALLGVFIVNAMGYPSAPNYPMPMGAPSPVDSMVALWINGFLAALVQGKAYPLLCFLFGYSLCSIAFQTNANAFIVKARLKLRYRKLLLIGMLHGVFVYFGDVLTIYAICGLMAQKWVTYRPKHLLQVFRKITIFVIVIFILHVLTAISFWFDSGKIELSFAKDNAETLIATSTLKSFWMMNASTYFTNTMYIMLTLPIYLWLTVAGILARRFRLFTLRHYAYKFWSKYLNHWHFVIALFLNLIISSCIAYQQGEANLSKLTALGALSTLINIWLVAAVLAVAMKYCHKVQHLPNWVYWLAPAGKHTLAMYLSLSLALMLSGGAFLDIQGSTLIRFVVVVSAWIFAVLFAKHATNRGFRDPISSWISIKN